MKLRFLDFLFPSLCDICKKGLDQGQSICPDCLSSLPRTEAPFCNACGEPFDGNLPDDFQCPNCHNLNFDFQFARAALRGLQPAFELVHSLKYLRRFYLAGDLARTMEEVWEADERFRNFDDDCLVIPVPLHWRRQQWRHGNQAYELAREFCLKTGLPLCNGLKRIRPTTTQTKLNRNQRLKNLRKSFEIRASKANEIKNSNVLLIDDVFTTGATAQSCSATLLKKGGARQVAVLSLVRG